ncbi:ferrous iron transport protein B [Planctomicrobium piriforme]|uniref:Ferrous iron transport protein B n=1 Tax=Planctomicrobium piriforme TaxID=1576369 RepID=A0A1I3AYY5_9PLAN|nr:ferrous iron transport protein B [Planctomicrobium piriforme]SFH55297.1 ferrous iron transport protein B [Planctomicrobium piriforme]
MPPVAPLAPTKTLTIALIGNPNTGKSTLFNGLTGGRARIGNFPGVTVEKKVGRFQHGGYEVVVVDLPGTYSLAPRSADEMVSVDVLLGRQTDVGRPDVVVCIVDANNLERNLYLFSQLRDLGLPVLLVLNMSDIAERNGVKIDLSLLQARLNVPAVATAAHHRTGLNEVREAIVQIAKQPVAAPRLFPAAFYDESNRLQSWLAEQGSGDVPEFLRERMLLDVHGEAEHRTSLNLGSPLSQYLAAARQRLLEGGCRIPLVETKVRYDWIRRQLDGVVQRTQPTGNLTRSDRIDRVLTHRVWGLLFFALLMFVIFQAIYTWAGPIMGLVEIGQGWVADLVSASMSPGTFRSLLVDGAIAGVGSVVVFLPQIVLLFAFIAVMEDCGYMARAAFLMDKLMTKVGLSGKSFLPLMSSFACAIPGVMATRVIENRRDRMVTILVAPLMSCSARLPVYLVMVGAFVPAITWLGGAIGLQGLVLFVMQALGAVVAVPIAWLLKKTLFKGETPPFVMELPEYKWPSPRIVLDRVWERAKAFILRAGSLIFCVTVLIWAAGYFPGDHRELQNIESEIEIEQQSLAAEESSPRLEELQQRRKIVSGELIRYSYLGRVGRAIEPAVKPLGWDWRIGVGAIASFPAREVIIATLGTIFSLGGEVDLDDEGQKSALVGALQSATWPDGAPLFTLPVAVSVMVFFALCAQCGATLMVIRRETNSWVWPVFTFVYMTALAYVGALLVYQCGTAILS